MHVLRAQGRRTTGQSSLALIVVAISISLGGCYVVQVERRNSIATETTSGGVLRTDALGSGIGGANNSATRACECNGEETGYERVELSAEPDAVGSNLSLGIACSAYASDITCQACPQP